MRLPTEKSDRGYRLLQINVLMPSQVFFMLFRLASIKEGLIVELLTKTSQAWDFVSILFVFRRVPRSE